MSAVFHPTCLYTGPWDPTRHDAVRSKVVTTQAAYDHALANGWRRRPDVETEPAGQSDADMMVEPESASDEKAPADASVTDAAPAGQQPKRRGPGRKRPEA